MHVVDYQHVYVHDLTTQVEVLWNIREREKAHSASTSAKNWAVASIICGLGIVLAVIFISTLWVVANRSRDYS